MLSHFGLLLLLSSTSSFSLGAELPKMDGYLSMPDNKTSVPASSSSSAGSVSGGGGGGDDASSLSRSAQYGHSDIAAGRPQDDSLQGKSLYGKPPPYVQPSQPYPSVSSGPLPSNYPSSSAPSYPSSSPYTSGGSGGGSGDSGSGGSSFPSIPSPPPSASGYNPDQLAIRDPVRGLAYLEYIAFLLETYPPTNCKRNSCDLSSFKQCTCVSPALYSPDGRGNCNLGVTKPDTQVWCYVSDKYGRPQDVCPDARESSSRPGYYWSRVACITE